MQHQHVIACGSASKRYERFGYNAGQRSDKLGPSQTEKHYQTQQPEEQVHVIPNSELHKGAKRIPIKGAPNCRPTATVPHEPMLVNHLSA